MWPLDTGEWEVVCRWFGLCLRCLRQCVRRPPHYAKSNMNMEPEWSVGDLELSIVEMAIQVEREAVLRSLVEHAMYERRRPIETRLLCAVLDSFRGAFRGFNALRDGKSSYV